MAAARRGAMAALKEKYPEPLDEPVRLTDGSKLAVYDETCRLTGKTVRVWDQMFPSGRHRCEKDSLAATNYGQVVHSSSFTPRTEGEEEKPVKEGAPAIVNSYVPKFAKPLLGRDFSTRKEFDKYMSDNKLYIPTFDEARNKLPTAPNAVHKKPMPKTSDEDGVTVTAATEPTSHMGQ